MRHCDLKSPALAHRLKTRIPLVFSSGVKRLQSERDTSIPLFIVVLVEHMFISGCSSLVNCVCGKSDEGKTSVEDTEARVNQNTHHGRGEAAFI